jgi:hypothetical protein
MSFESYRSISEVLTEYQIQAIDRDFIPAQVFVVDEVFREDLMFSLREFNFDESEYGVCEAVIFPILKTVYRGYRDAFVLWSHKTLTYDANLTGIPDYLLAKRSPLGKTVFDQPYFVAIEAKRDDFIKGWGQCLAEMVAMQKLNANPDQAIYGVVSNGQFWQLGMLQNTTFTKNLTSYTVSDLDRLMGAIDFLFKSCLDPNADRATNLGST